MILMYIHHTLKPDDYITIQKIKLILKNKKIDIFGLNNFFFLFLLLNKIKIIKEIINIINKLSVTFVKK